MTRIASNPFHDWSYSTNLSSRDTPTGVTTIDSTPITDVASTQNKTPDTISVKPNLKRGRKRNHPVTSEHDLQRTAINFKNKEKDDKGEKEPKEQIQLQELYYATMEGDKNLILKEYKSPLYFKV